VARVRPTDHLDSAPAAYSLALRWLTGRELSEGQVRQRLSRKGYSDRAIDDAVGRLVTERVVDDRRAAMVVARIEARVRRHGPRRILGRLVAMRIDRDLAKAVVAELFEDTAEDVLLDEALERRLRGQGDRLRDPGQRRKLLAYLVRRGFSAAAASGLIRRKLRQKYNSE
jgi:regulatory protein